MSFRLGVLVAGAATAFSACGPPGGAAPGETGGAPAGGGTGGGFATGGAAPGGFGGTGTGGTLFEGNTGGNGGQGGDVCGSASIDVSVEEIITPGNLLVIYDQSQSMTEDWNGKPRWLAASDAVLAAIDPIKDLLTIGAVFFPSLDGIPIPLFPCDVNLVSPIGDAASPNPQIPFMPGPQFIDAWVQHWTRGPLRLSTPIEAGLTRGAEALSSSSLTGATVIVLVTDGEPTCGTQAASETIVATALSNGTKTYVIGIPGSQNAGTYLNALAVAGGTNQYLDTAQSADLAQALRDITSTIVARSIDSCSITFNEQPEDPTKVVLVVTDAASGQRFQVNGGPEGWSLAADGTGATLEGTTCQEALDGRFSNLAFEFGCVDVPVLR